MAITITGSRTLAQAITFVANIVLCITIIYHFLRTRHVTGNSLVTLRRKRMVTSSLLVLVITMVSICFSVVTLINIVSYVTSSKPDTPDGSTYDNLTITALKSLLFEILSSINFVFYLILSSEFREKFMEVVMSCTEVKQPATGPQE